MSEPDYRCMLSWRLSSFLDYPNDAFFRPPQLASMGFYRTGQGEEVMCYGCRVAHANFRMGQSIRRAHMLMSPDCPLNAIGNDLQGDDASAAPYFVPQAAPVPLPREDLPVEGDGLIRYFSWELQAYIVFNRSHPKKGDFKLLDVEGNRLRRCTFHDWPEQNGEWEQLALRGLYYTGTLDTVQCCVCSARYRASTLQHQPSTRRTTCLLAACRPYFF